MSMQAYRNKNPVSTTRVISSDNVMFIVEHGNAGQSKKVKDVLQRARTGRVLKMHHYTAAELRRIFSICGEYVVATKDQVNATK